MWFDLSWVCRSRQDREGEIKALKQALQISPNWGTAVRQLSEVYEQAEEFDQSRQLLEEAIARTPLDPYNYGCLADLLWKLNEKETAIANLEKAVQLEPGYTWAWNTLRDWSRELQRKEVAVQLARDLTVRRGGEARSWLLLAETLTQPEELEERLAALNQALALNPRYLDAIDLKAKLLAQAQRYEEALATCHSDACQWLCDWQGRSDLKPWMLSNLAEALRGLKQDKESNRVSKHALTLAADHATYIHRLWLAFDEALAGRSPLAANQLRQVDFSSIEPYYQFLYLLAQAMLEAQAKSEKRQHRFNEARSQLRKGLTAYPTFGKNLLMRRAYHQCVWLLAKDSRSLVALMWALWQWVSR